MQKLILLIFFSFFILSCTEKEKIYEELEAEVLCDVLPQLAHEIIMTKLPPPPPPEEDYEKYNYKPLSIEDFIKLRDIQRDSVRILAKKKHKIHIGLNSLMFFVNKSEFKIANQTNISIDSLKDRKFRPNELLNSTLKIKFVENDTIAKRGEFIDDSEIEALSSITRVLFNDRKSKAFFKLYPFSCSPYSIEVVSEKVNNKWVVKEIIKE